jgi:hypothetical protein
MRRRRFPKLVRYPVWSIKTITITAIVVVSLTALLVFGLGKWSLFHETEVTLGVVAAALFAFLAVGLYRGARVRRWDLPGADVKNVSMDDLRDGLPDALSVDFSGGSGGADLSGGADSLEGCFGAIVAVVVGLFAGVILLFLLWLLLNLGVVVWVFLLAALSWVFYLALRQVFAKSRLCRGNLAASLGYALFYTLLYTGWLFALVFVAHGWLGPKLAGAG